MLKIIAQIISKLHQISINNTSSVLNKKRLKWEMDFFIKHYIQNNISETNKDRLRANLYTIVDNISDEKFFCHRDFHSRNMHIYNDNIYLIDFQDSLQGSYLYDIVSFANDSYLDLGKLRPYFFSQLENQNIKIDKKQLNLTALQRNIKALGTFGYQINIRKNLSYKKYIGRTLSHIKKNSESNSIQELIQI
jgi:aminoglycoside/choline kinase family phosphotransferase